MILGCHVSIGSGIHKAVEDAISVKANACQFFSRNPRGGKAKALNQLEIDQAKQLVEQHQIEVLVAHAPYTINMCSPKEDLRFFARQTVLEDLSRSEAFGCNYYVIHPGSHVNQGMEHGKKLIAQGINEVLAGYQGPTMLLLETMASQGTEVGGTFAELADIISRLDEPERVGICIDTCHLFAGGYSIIRPDEFIDEVEARMPLDKIKLCHLNDSKTPEGSFKDRHAPIGQGEIGWENLLNFISHPKFCHLPFILETPGELAHYGEEIAQIRAQLGLNVSCE